MTALDDVTIPIGVGGLAALAPPGWKAMRSNDLEVAGVVEEVPGSFAASVMFMRTDDGLDVPLTEITPGLTLLDHRPDHPLLGRIVSYAQTSLGFTAVITQLWLTTVDGPILVTATAKLARFAEQRATLVAILTSVIGDDLTDLLERWI